MKKLKTLYVPILTMGILCAGTILTSQSAAADNVLKVIASSDYYNGFANMRIHGNRYVYGHETIKADNRKGQKVTITKSLPNAIKEFGLSFTNDEYNRITKQDRNLIIHKISLNGKNIPLKSLTLRACRWSGLRSSNSMVLSCKADKVSFKIADGKQPQPTPVPTPAQPTPTPQPAPAPQPVPQPAPNPDPSSGSSNLDGAPKGHPGVSKRLLEFTGAKARNHPESAMRTYCRMSHFNYDDPILYPGQVGRSHLHMYFGNTKANANSTPESIRNSGNSTCDGGIANRSAYWIPAMMTADNTLIPAAYMNAYYKTGWGPDENYQRTLISMPDGLRIIGGNGKANNNNRQDKSISSYHCRTSNGNTYNNGITIPNCKSGERVVMTVRFPACWDGKRLNSSDQSHMAYQPWGKCPASHPVLVPTVTTNVYFDVRTNTKGWHLSSDMYDWKTHGGGLSGHSDWFDGWEKSVKDAFWKGCLKKGPNSGNDCGDNLLGNGNQSLDGLGSNIWKFGSSEPISTKSFSPMR